MTNGASSRRRYLALWFPLLPIDRLRGLHGTGDPRPRRGVPADGPLVVAEPVRGALKVRAACRQAAALGLGPGLALADARARVPDLAVAFHDPAADAALLERLADAADWVTPSLALDPPDGLVLDVTGCTGLWGGEDRLRADLLAQFARLGIEVHAALGATPDAARALVRFGRRRGAAGGSGGTGAGSLLDLPVAALGLPMEARVALARAGLRRVGDLAARPASMLAARFGEAAVTRLRRVLGEEDQRVSPRRPPSPIVAEQAFAEPIGRLEDAEATLAILLRRAAEALAAKGQGGRALEAAFFRTDGVVRRVRVETGRPTRDPFLLGRLFRDRLESLADPLDPGFGFELIRLAVLVTGPLGPLQEGLDAGASWQAGVAEDEVSDLADRLAARFGRHSVTRFVPIDSHDPDRAARRVPAVGSTPVSGWPEPLPGGPPLRPLHVLAPPQPVEALAPAPDGFPDGPPSRFRWRRVLHEVARAEGPERIAGEWWRGEPPVRDYYRVEDREGRRFWMFRVEAGGDAPRPLWYLHGLFA